MTNSMTAILDLIRADDLLADLDHEQIACDMICDLLTAQRLISIPDECSYPDELTDALCDLAALRDSTPDDDITALARDTFNDPTESFHAAHIRDTCRDNPTD